jgi:Ca-activated chloride channel homolog
MSAATGGKAYFAKSWRDEKKAFASIRNDLGHLYSISYYPAVNPNHRWRAINVKLVGERAKKYHIRSRNGYRPPADPLVRRERLDVSRGIETSSELTG